MSKNIPLPEDFGEFKNPTQAEVDLIKDNMTKRISEEYNILIQEVLAELIIFLLSSYIFGIFAALITFFAFFVSTIIFRKTLLFDIFCVDTDSNIKFVQLNDIKTNRILMYNYISARIKNDNGIVYNKYFRFSENESEKISQKVKNNQNCEFVLIEKKKNRYSCVYIRTDI